MAIAQTAFRFGGNDGTESTHSFLAALNTPIERGATDASTFLLRILIQATGTGQTNYAPQWQYSKNAGTWTSITTTSAVVKAVTTTVFTNGQDATSRLGGTGTFVTNNDGCSHDGLAGGANFDIATDGRGETVESLQLVPANIAVGDVIGIRVSGVTSYTQVAMIVATDASAFAPNPVYFDGTNDYGEHLAALTGIADSGLVSFAFMFRPTGTVADQHIFSCTQTTGNGTYRLIIGRDAAAKVYMAAQNSTPAVVLSARSSALAVDTYYSVCGSVDLSSTSLRHLYINDVSDLATVTTYTVGGTINFSAAVRNAIGAAAGNFTLKLNGDLVFLWVDPGRYVDFSVEANRRLFFDSTNYPEDLGKFGEIPFSAQPKVFLAGPTASFLANRGTGLGFTPVGALTDGTVIPAGGVNVEPSTVGLAIAGQAPTLAANTSTSPITVALVLTGQAVTFAASHTAAPTTSALTLTGQAPTVAASAAAAPTTQALTLTGFTPTFAAHHTALPAVVALTFTGEALTLMASSVMAPMTQALTLIGQVPTVTAASNITAEPTAGSLALTGLAPTVTATATAEPTTAMLALSGLSPTVTTTGDVVLQSTTGTLALVGQAPTFAASFAGAPTTHGLTIVGLAPALVVSFTAQSAAGALLITGQAPTWSVIASFAADTVLASSNLQDTLSNIPPTRMADIDEPADADDTEWWTAVDPALVTETRVGIVTPPANALVGQQRIRVLVRATSLPARDVTVELWESGVKLTSEITESVISDTGQIVELVFDASEVTDPADVEVRVFAEAA